MNNNARYVFGKTQVLISKCTEGEFLLIAFEVSGKKHHEIHQTWVFLFIPDSYLVLISAQCTKLV